MMFVPLFFPNHYLFFTFKYLVFLFTAQPNRDYPPSDRYAGSHLPPPQREADPRRPYPDVLQRGLPPADDPRRPPLQDDLRRRPPLGADHARRSFPMEGRRPVDDSRRPVDDRRMPPPTDDRRRSLPDSDRGQPPPDNGRRMGRPGGADPARREEDRRPLPARYDAGKPPQAVDSKNTLSGLSTALGEGGAKIDRGLNLGSNKPVTVGAPPIVSEGSVRRGDEAAGRRPPPTQRVDDRYRPY